MASFPPLIFLAVDLRVVIMAPFRKATWVIAIRMPCTDDTPAYSPGPERFDHETALPLVAPGTSLAPLEDIDEYRRRRMLNLGRSAAGGGTRASTYPARHNGPRAPRRPCRRANR